MSPFVVLSLTLLVAILGVLGVVVVHLLRSFSLLRAAVDMTRQRLQPLIEELQAEVAVASLESETLQASLAGLRDSRRPRRGIPRPVQAAPPRSPAPPALPPHL